MMKKVWTIFMLSAVFFMAFLCVGDDLAYPVFQLKKAPALDGNWTDAAWKDVPEASGLTTMKSGKLFSLRQTVFKMGYYGKNLYLAVKCYEPDPENIKTDENNYRDGWYPDDHLEFFFSKNRTSARKFKQFVFNSRGARWCNITAHGDSNKWSAAAKREKDFWCTEIRIPFALLGVENDFNKQNFYFNLARISNKNSGEESLSCYAPVLSGFGNVSKFTELIFRNAPDAKTLAESIKKLNKLGKWSRGKLWRMANVREAFLANKKNDPAVIPFLALKKQAKKVLASKDIGNALSLISEYEKFLAELSRPVKKVTLEVRRKNANAKVYLNGKLQQESAAGKYKLTLQEGLSTLAVECTAAGARPAISLKLLSCPETDGRWKYSSAPGKEWMTLEYNDKNWTSTAAKNGFVWSANPKDKKLCLRQTVLYNKSHDGPNRCLNPLVKEWGFSRNSTEAIFLALYPPVKGMRENYEFVLDLPQGFRLLDMKHKHPAGWWGPKVNINSVPSEVVKKTIVRNGKKFTRNILKYSSSDIREDYTFATILPVKLDSSRKVGEKHSFYFHRKQSGNFTEIEQTLPVVILPEINGKMPKEFILSMYCSRPYFGAHVSDEALKELMGTAFKAGFNTWIHQPDRSGKSKYFELFKKLIEEKNARQIAHFRNFPAWRGSLEYGSFRSFINQTPEAKARYFNDFPAIVSHSTNLKTLKKNWERAVMYCPTYMTTVGKDKFVELLEKDLKKYLASFDNKLFAYWINWESEPWQASNAYLKAKTGLGSYCFCDKCKKCFYKSIGLPENSNISDEKIYKNYYNEWKSFRYKQDGKIQGQIRDACHKLGLKYMVYSWLVQEPFWEACKGRIDFAFPGCPGNAPANSTRQQLLDKAMDFFREKLGMDKILGQRFTFFGTYYSIRTNGWKKYLVMSPDGYIDAKSWKSQFLRIAAAMHGGLDMQSALECVGGMMYYIGEATRAISTFEDLFLNGKREDSLAVSKEIRYPDLLVLTRGSERLVLLFNESGKPLTVQLENKKLKKGQIAEIWEKDGKISNPAKMKVSIPAGDVVLVHIK